MCFPFRPCGTLEGCLHSVHERQVWKCLQAKDGQVWPDLWLWRLRSNFPHIFCSTTSQSTYLHRCSRQVHRSTKFQSLQHCNWEMSKKEEEKTSQRSACNHEKFLISKPAWAPPITVCSHCFVWIYVHI